jgi:Domain of unknown function (DUF4062)
MNLPRYQIFVSSTFKDLIDERRAVLEAILKLNQFPAGMETFPAVNDPAWELIEKVIKDSDYYVLIIGGKYGSIDAESGLSYTEKEYDFAVSNNIPVLAFIHKNIGSIISDKTESSPKIKKKLAAFKNKVSKHHCNFWMDAGELKANISSSLIQSFFTNPQKGWVKAGGIEKSELLERLAELQQRYDLLKSENNKLKEQVVAFDDSTFSFGNDKVELQLKKSGTVIENILSITWIELFQLLGKHLIPTISEVKVTQFLANIVEAKTSTYAHLTENSFEKVRNQLLVLGLIEMVSKSSRGTEYPAWTLSAKGRKLILTSIAEKKLQVE